MYTYSNSYLNDILFIISLVMKYLFILKLNVKKDTCVFKLNKIYL